MLELLESNNCSVARRQLHVELDDTLLVIFNTRLPLWKTLHT